MGSVINIRKSKTWLGTVQLWIARRLLYMAYNLLAKAA